MLGIKKDIDCLIHLLLATIAQGNEFYNSQTPDIKNYFGEEIFNEAERLLKDTYIYKLLAGN